MAKRDKRENKLGIDVGLNKPVALSNGVFLGEDLRDLRIKTKWRKYNGISAYKQGLNRVSNEITTTYKDTDFVVENLLFKGKKNRNKEFRRRNNNWAYGWLQKRLEEHGKLEGFNVIKVNPAYTSQTCPSCSHVDKANRVGEKFQCLKCGYINHADIVGALNILERVAWEPSVPKKSAVGG